LATLNDARRDEFVVPAHQVAAMSAAVEPQREEPSRFRRICRSLAAVACSVLATRSEQIGLVDKGRKSAAERLAVARHLACLTGKHHIRCLGASSNTHELIADNAPSPILNAVAISKSVKIGFQIGSDRRLFRQRL